MENASELRLEGGKIEFENVHFSYVDGYGLLGTGWDLLRDLAQECRAMQWP